ncbi:hypothetical protein C8R47DRAFT_1062721 [Mycena vitilis]|nr:hypothetical protein C8R47DRAFT_1062721 [Mycena vitilis]
MGWLAMGRRKSEEHNRRTQDSRGTSVPDGYSQPEGWKEGGLERRGPRRRKKREMVEERKKGMIQPFYALTWFNTLSADTHPVTRCRLPFTALADIGNGFHCQKSYGMFGSLTFEIKISREVFPDVAEGWIHAQYSERISRDPAGPAVLESEKELICPAEASCLRHERCVKEWDLESPAIDGDRAGIKNGGMPGNQATSKPPLHIADSLEDLPRASIMHNTQIYLGDASSSTVVH